MSSVSKKMMQAAAGAGGEGPYWINLLSSGGKPEEGNAVAIDSSNNIIVCGYTESDGAGNSDLLFAKYDTLGDLQWAKTLGGSGVDIGYGVAIDSSDNIIVCGTTAPSGAVSNNFLVAKFNSSGTPQWDRTLSRFDDIGYGVAIDSSDNIVVCGTTYSGSGPGNDLLVAKYNSSGTLQWDKVLGGNQNDEGNAVAIDSSDNIIVCGYTRSDGAGAEDLLVAKYNSSGTLQWDKTLGGSGSDRGLGVAIDSSDNIIVCGYTQSDGAGISDLLVAKYNSSGTLQWDKTLGGSDHDYGHSVAIDSSDNIIVCGYTYSGSSTSGDLLVAKYNSSGTLQWTKTLGSSSTDRGYGVAIDSSDNIIVCGYVYPSALLVAKLPSDGTGDGTYVATYASLIYQDKVLTDADAVLTDEEAVLTDADSLVSSKSVVLTDAPAVLTEEFFEITP